MKKIISFLIVNTALFCSPQEPNIIQANVSLESLSPEFLKIHVNDEAYIEWRDFSIELGEKTEFIQPHQEAVVINRVLETFPSRILGELRSNGKIVLVNPDGIFIGKEAIIDTGSLIASTLDLNTHVKDFSAVQ